MSGGLEPEIQLLPDLVDRRKTSLDVGANFGTYTLPLSRLSQRVIAFEPMPACAQVLRKWAFGRNVTVNECALGEVNGVMTLRAPWVNGRVASTRASLVRVTPEEMLLEVRVRTLDSLALTDVGFIKIDIEGFELPMLRGAARTIERCQPHVLVEIDGASLGLAAVEDTFSWFEDQRYLGYFLMGSRLIACRSGIEAVRRGVYNFVFSPRSGRVW
jgi:FkbM family methyltransferase